MSRKVINTDRHVVSVVLDEASFEALRRLSKACLRIPSAQVKWLVERELVRAGLLSLPIFVPEHPEEEKDNA